MDNQITIVTNKREVPCEGCRQKSRCSILMRDCKAFRYWTNNGNFKDADVNHLVRAI